MQAYLFVHFREKTTPDGEQVHFGLSRDGFHWEMVNGGAPVLWAYYGDKGVRDFTITRCRESGKYFIFATDLSLAYGLRNQYQHSWENIARHGSRDLAMWESEDLVNWSEQRMIRIGDEKMGCVWAPDIIYDRESGDYVLHWSSSHAETGYREKGIYYSRTRDFETFSAPKPLHRIKGRDLIDSAIYEEGGMYYLFVKSERDPGRVQLLCSERAAGPYDRMVDGFEQSMRPLEEGKYEAPTAVRLEDGRWLLLLDYYGVPGKGQGYVPFASESLAGGAFVRSDQSFHFPYGFKHGTILPITQEDYERIRLHDWSDPGWI